MTTDEEETHEADAIDENEGDVATKKAKLPAAFLGGLHYNIQIHLPESRDPKVYDAIFDALKRHLN